jgi:hypothetical protein
MGVAVAEELRPQIAEIRREFGARWQGIDREEQEALAERKNVDGRQNGRKWWRVSNPFLELGIANTKVASTSGYHGVSQPASCEDDSGEAMREGAGICVV